MLINLYFASAEHLKKLEGATIKKVSAIDDSNDAVNTNFEIRFEKDNEKWILWGNMTDFHIEPLEEREKLDNFLETVFPNITKEEEEIV